MADGRTTSAGEAKRIIEGLLSGEKKRYDDSKRQLFISAWLAIAKAEGANPTVVGYLYKGLDIAGAEPLYRLAPSAEGEEIYKKFFLSRGAFTEKAGTLKIALNLLSYELNNPTTQDSLDFVARRLCDAAMSLGKRAQASIKGNITALLIRPLAKCGLSVEAHIESSRASNLDNFLRPGLEAAISKKGAKEDIIRTAKEIIDWLGKQKVAIANDDPEMSAPVAEESKVAVPTPPKDIEPSEQPIEPGEQPIEPSEQASRPGQDLAPASSEPATTNAPTDGEEFTSSDAPTVSKPTAGTVRKSATPTESDESAKRVTAAKSERKSSKSPTKGKEDNHDDLDMAAVITFLRKFQKRQDELERQLKSVCSEKVELSSKVFDLEQSLRAARREIEDLKERRTTLSGNYSALQQQCEALRAESQSLRSELEDANEMIAILDEGATHEVDATMGGLGRELSYDYRKYLDAADQPMTAELGGIVLRQLRTVFEILKKHGIELS